MGYEKIAIPSLEHFIRTRKWPKRPDGSSVVPIREDIASGETGTNNHWVEAIAVGYCKNRKKSRDHKKYRDRVIAMYKRELREGHMLYEFNSCSHWQHHAAGHGAILITAIRRKDDEVIELALQWFAINHSINMGTWLKEARSNFGSSVTVCCRGFKGDEPGGGSDEQWSWMRDEFVRLIELKKDFRGAYSSGLDAEAVSILRSIPREFLDKIGDDAEDINPSTIAAVAHINIYETDFGDWIELKIPDENVRNWLKPYVYAASNEVTGNNRPNIKYFCDKAQAEKRFHGGDFVRRIGMRADL